MRKYEITNEERNIEEQTLPRSPKRDQRHPLHARSLPSIPEIPFLTRISSPGQTPVSKFPRFGAGSNRVVPPLIIKANSMPIFISSGVMNSRISDIDAQAILFSLFIEVTPDSLRDEYDRFVGKYRSKIMKSPRSARVV